jgi:hypothetical protein
MTAKRPEPSVPELPLSTAELVLPSLITPIEASYDYGDYNFGDPEYGIDIGVGDPITTVTGLINVPDENVEQEPRENVEDPGENVQNSVPPFRALRKMASRITGRPRFFSDFFSGPRRGGPRRGGTRKRKMTKRKMIKRKMTKRKI